MGSAASRDVNGMKTITLISSDNERFEVPEAAASLSQFLRNAIENGSGAAAGGNGIHLSKISGKVLAKVLEYCNKHAAAVASKTVAGGCSGDDADCNKHAAVASTTGAAGCTGDDAASSGEATNDKEELRRFDEAFVDVDQSMLYDLLLAAFYLEVEGLEVLAFQKVVKRMEDMTAEIRKRAFLRIKDNYFPPPPDDKEDDEKQWQFV